jgi:hypothetical protein
MAAWNFTEEPHFLMDREKMSVQIILGKVGFFAELTLEVFLSVVGLLGVRFRRGLELMNASIDSLTFKCARSLFRM